MKFYIVIITDRSPFEYIRNHPDLRDTTSMIRENPEMLSVLLQRVADENPELLQVILTFSCC